MTSKPETTDMGRGVFMLTDSTYLCARGDRLPMQEVYFIESSALLEHFELDDLVDLLRAPLGSRFDFVSAVERHAGPFRGIRNECILFEKPVFFSNARVVVGCREDDGLMAVFAAAVYEDEYYEHKYEDAIARCVYATGKRLHAALEAHTQVLRRTSAWTLAPSTTKVTHAP